MKSGSSWGLNILLNQGDSLDELIVYKTPFVRDEVTDHISFAKCLKSNAYTYAFYEGDIWIVPLEQKSEPINELQQILTSILERDKFEIKTDMVNLSSVDDERWKQIFIVMLKDSLIQALFQNKNIFVKKLKEYGKIAEAFDPDTSVFTEAQSNIKVVPGICFLRFYPVNLNNVGISIDLTVDVFSPKEEASGFHPLSNSLQKQSYLTRARNKGLLDDSIDNKGSVLYRLSERIHPKICISNKLLDFGMIASFGALEGVEEVATKPGTLAESRIKQKFLDDFY